MKFVIPDREFSGYIFDCDGTLADTMPLHYRAWKRTLEEHGAPFSEVIEDHKHFAALLKWPSTNFGAGYSGRNLLAEFQRDQIKIDINLVRGIERNAPRQTVVRAINQACEDFGINVIAEGVETLEEYRWFEVEHTFISGLLLSHSRSFTFCAQERG